LGVNRIVDGEKANRVAGESEFLTVGSTKGSKEEGKSKGEGEVRAKQRQTEFRSKLGQRKRKLFSWPLLKPS